MLDRLRAMRPAEVGFRLRRSARSRLERAGLGRAHPGAPAGRTGAPWVGELPRRLDAGPYAAAADRVLAGTFDVLALRGASLGFPPAWNVDPKTGTCAPLRFGKTLDYRSSALVGDVKYLWELNRHLELVTLAQAWHLTREPRFAEGCRRLIDSWLTECPYPFGANWCSSLEIAVRLVNWACAWQLLGAEESVVFAGAEGTAFRQRWLASIYQHCHFVSGHLSRHSSANNHLLGELAGLEVASLTWPLWTSSPRWLAQASGQLNAQALAQTHADGVNKEQALWYHASVADMLLLAGLIARANGRDPGRAYWLRTEKMVEFVASIMDCAGSVPGFGDADDGVLVRWAPLERGELWRSLLATGAVLFERAEFAAKAARFDEKSRWLLGDEAEHTFARLAAEPPVPGPLPLPRFFPQGGYYLLGDAFDTPREVKIVADAGPLGYLSIAAHGHADALSFTLSAAGQPVLIDPGTYGYHSEPKWRRYFRGTRAHNTVCIDGLDQSRFAGSFLWLDHARTTVEAFEPDGVRRARGAGGGSAAARERLVASHDGYCRLRDPVRHRRTIEYDRERFLLAVTDELACRGPHGIELNWHFAPQCRVALRGGAVVAQVSGVRLTLEIDPRLECRLESGRETAPLGWCSPSYDVKVPATSVSASGAIRGFATFVTKMRIELP
jgi:hypothetical protein